MIIIFTSNNYKDQSGLGTQPPNLTGLDADADTITAGFIYYDRQKY